MKQMKVFIYILVTAFILSSCSIQKRCQAPELNLPDEIIAGICRPQKLISGKWKNYTA